MVKKSIDETDESEDEEEPEEEPEDESKKEKPKTGNGLIKINPKKRELIEALLQVYIGSFSRPANLYPEVFVDQCVNKGIISDEESDELDDDEFKDLMFLMYLYNKGTISVEVLKTIFNGEEFMYHQSEKYQKILRDQLGIKFI